MGWTRIAGRQGGAAGGARRTFGSGGVTAVELLILVVLLVILAAIAIPGMSPVVLNLRLRGAAWQLAGDLRLARQRAVTLRKPFRICLASADPPSPACRITVPEGSYSLERQDSQWVSETGAPIRLPQDVSIAATATPVFSATGATVPASTFTLTNIIGSYQVKVASTGRVKVCRGTC